MNISRCARLVTRKYVNSFKMGLSGSTGPFLLRRAAPSLWRDTGCDPHDPTTLTRPVIRLGGYNEEPFMKAQSTAACGFRPARPKRALAPPFGPRRFCGALSEPGRSR